VHREITPYDYLSGAARGLKSKPPNFDIEQVLALCWAKLNVHFGYFYPTTSPLFTFSPDPVLFFKKIHKGTFEIEMVINQVVWAPVGRSSFQGRTWGILGSILRENNVWSVRMPLRTSRISRQPLVGGKPMRKKKKW